jgi:hypothetical protein
MAKQHVHNEAARLAGDVFGRILNRQADPGGYEYVLDCFESGRKSIQQIIFELMTSDEFVDNFMKADDPAQNAKLVRKLLLGRPNLDDAEVAEARRRIVREGLRGYVGEIINSPDYRYLVGPDRVPAFGH